MLQPKTVKINCSVKIFAASDSLIVLALIIIERTFNLLCCQDKEKLSEQGFAMKKIDYIGQKLEQLTKYFIILLSLD